MISAVDASKSLYRATSSCATSFLLISSREMCNAAPEEWGERLGSAEFGVGRADGPSRDQDGAVALEHHKACVLIGQPAERFKRYKPVRADDDEPLQPVAHAGKSDFASLRAYAILDFEMATLHSHFDSVARKRENATSADC